MYVQRRLLLLLSVPALVEHSKPLVSRETCRIKTRLASFGLVSQALEIHFKDTQLLKPCFRALHDRSDHTCKCRTSPSVGSRWI